MSNHCIDAICAHCGATRCLLGCNKEESNETLQQAFQQIKDTGISIHHYECNVCHCCGNKTMYSIPADMPYVIQTILKNQTSV